MNLHEGIKLVADGLQFGVAGYALFLNRIFGSNRVGWSLCCAFSLLALLHLFQSETCWPADAQANVTFEAVYSLTSLLLLTGMVHIGTLFKQRMRFEQKEKNLRAELEVELEKRTRYLLRAVEGLDLEKAERNRMEAKAACLDLIKPCLFDCFSEMIANIPTSSIIRVLTEESYMLGVDLTKQRPLLPTDVGSILIFSQFVGAAGKCPHSHFVGIRLPAEQVAFYRKTIDRLLLAGELPHYTEAEFEKTFGRHDASGHYVPLREIPLADTGFLYATA